MEKEEWKNDIISRAYPKILKKLKDVVEELCEMEAQEYPNVVK
jgi:hypothetical protein